MKQHQIIALVAGKKARHQKLMTEAYRGWDEARMTGLDRRYTPIDDEGEQFPPESRSVQIRVSEEIPALLPVIGDFLNMVGTQECANTQAKADVVVEDMEILKDVPVTMLLFLEKQLVDLLTFARSMPTLPTDREWKFDGAKNCYVSGPETTRKTAKVPAALVLYAATKEHPAQTQAYNKDILVGNWSIMHSSGAADKLYKQRTIDRIIRLQDAVKVAREEANSIEAVQAEQYEGLLDYIFES